MDSAAITPSVKGVSRDFGHIMGVTRNFGLVTSLVTGVTRLQGARHSVCHRSDHSPRHAASIFAFLNLNPCNVIVILVTPSLF